MLDTRKISWGIINFFSFYFILLVIEILKYFGEIVCKSSTSLVVLSCFWDLLLVYLVACLKSETKNISYNLSFLISGSANVSVTKASVLGGDNGNGSTGGAVGLENGILSDEDEEDDDDENFWHTSVGKFKFTLDTLPQTLQYIHQLLTVRDRNV